MVTSNRVNHMAGLYAGLIGRNSIFQEIGCRIVMDSIRKEDFVTHRWFTHHAMPIAVSKATGTAWWSKGQNTKS